MSKPLSDFLPNMLNRPETLADIDPGMGSAINDVLDDYKSIHASLGEDEVGRRVAAGLSVVGKLLAKCESPIEKLIVPALVFQTYGHGSKWVPAEHGDDKPRFSPVAIDAQVALDRSRFDFLMLVELCDKSGVVIAVECDGAEFHDIGRDLSRDLGWQSAGIHTVRLSGSDITRNPRMAASRVAELVLQRMIKRGLA